MKSPFPSVVRLQMRGEYDISNTDSLRDMLLPVETADAVIIDMSETSYIDSSALHCLIHLKKQMLARGGGAIKLVGTAPNVRKLFDITGLNELFDITNHAEAG